MTKKEQYEAAASAMVEAAGLARSNRDELVIRLGGVFGRREPRMAAGGYIDGMCAELGHKSGWSVAELAGDRRPDRMQRLLNKASWDHWAAMDIVGDFVVQALDDGDAVAVLDESGREKKGDRTAGVQRQYVGCVGKVSNAINIVYLSYASSRGHSLVAARPYLPKSWTGDERRRDRAQVPAELEFATKPALGVDMLEVERSAGRLPGWVTGDDVYGRDTKLRTWCQDQQVGYVLGVPCSFRITLTSGRKVRADQALKLVPNLSWNRASAGTGSKGQRLYHWAWIATNDPRHHLLIRRSLTPGDKGEFEVAFFYSHVPQGRPVTLATLARIAGMRWPVEEDFQTGKDHFGLDHSQVRLYPALIRHLVLSMAALAICAVTAATTRPATTALPPPPIHPDDEPPDDPGLIGLTIAEIKRLLNLATHTWHGLTHHLRWAWWRRRHQARAAWFHQRTRLQREATA